MSNVDWGKLVAQGRAKDIGVPWGEEELKALYNLKIPADYVRKGCLTIEDYNEALATGEKPKTKEELSEEAKKEGLNITPDAPKEVVEKLLKEKKVKKVSKKK